jgi:hypothetical protein
VNGVASLGAEEIKFFVWGLRNRLQGWEKITSMMVYTFHHLMCVKESREFRAEPITLKIRWDRLITEPPVERV